MKPIATLRRFMRNADRAARTLVRTYVEPGGVAIDDGLAGVDRPPTGVGKRGACRLATREAPLVIADRTYNTWHPDYDANLVRNCPGTILNADAPCANAVYRALATRARKNRVPDASWARVLAQARAEAERDPGYAQTMDRRDQIASDMARLSARYKATYEAGWINIADALFLYWLVRELKPRSIVQTGVCNGLSSAFMVLALARNGGPGTLRAIDLPAVFDSGDPAWTIENNVYGVVIPEGEEAGSLVPDAHRDRFELQQGDARTLLPSLIDAIDGVDLFYHDSTHTYEHMTFEFGQAARKLRAGGLIVADDISWNASLWDFADERRVPAYNYKGAVGVAFF